MKIKKPAIAKTAKKGSANTQNEIDIVLFQKFVKLRFMLFPYF